MGIVSALEGSLPQPPVNNTSMMDGCEDTAVSEPLRYVDGSIDNDISDSESRDIEYHAFRNHLNDLLLSTSNSANALADGSTVQQGGEISWKNFDLLVGVMSQHG